MILAGLRFHVALGAAVVGVGSVIAVAPMLASPPPQPHAQTPAIDLTASDTDIFTPDTTTFDPTVAEGYPPLDDVLQGKENWDFSNPPSDTSATLFGVDTQTTIGSFSNNDFLETGYVEQASNGATLPPLPEIGSEIDLANFGGGFENEWISLVPVGGGADTFTDILITPFGDFTLF